MATLNGQVSYELRTDPLWDMPEPQSFNQELVDKYVNQLVETGSCPALLDCGGEPMTYEEAYKTVIETMTADEELRA